MAVGAGLETRHGETTTLQFIVAWAEERVSDGVGGVGGHRRVATALSPPQVAVVLRRAALLLGDRPLTDVTFGDLARLPSLLEDAGMAPGAARLACREIGGALRAALCGVAGEELPARLTTGPHHQGEELRMGERDEIEKGRGAGPAGESGQRIPGRDFAGASYASTEREQTADRRGESERHRMDDAQNVGGEEQEGPRDES
jgi:hypothetical protein